MNLHDTPFKRRTNDALIKRINRSMNANKRLPLHAYLTADGAYRAMMRGMENDLLINGGNRSSSGSNGRGNVSMNHKFKLLSQIGSYDRRDKVSDESNHRAMLDAMVRTSVKLWH